MLYSSLIFSLSAQLSGAPYLSIFSWPMQHVLFSTIFLAEQYSEPQLDAFTTTLPTAPSQTILSDISCPSRFLIVPVRTYQSSLLFRVGVKSRLCRSSPIFKNCVLSFPSPPFATLDHHLFGHTLDLEHGYRHIDHIHDMMTW